jgi:hypothetical protein
MCLLEAIAFCVEPDQHGEDHLDTNSARALLQALLNDAFIVKLHQYSIKTGFCHVFQRRLEGNIVSLPSLHIVAIHDLL